jgi:hypothetical protein
MDGDAIGAVFERVILGDRRAGQLAVLADQQHAGAQLHRQRRAEQEAARLDPRDQIDLAGDLPRPSGRSSAASPSASSSSVVMSRNMIPGLGKSGMVRMRRRISSLSLRHDASYPVSVRKAPAEAHAAAGLREISDVAQFQCFTPRHTVQIRAISEPVAISRNSTTARPTPSGGLHRRLRGPDEERRNVLGHLVDRSRAVPSE